MRVKNPTFLLIGQLPWYGVQLPHVWIISHFYLIISQSTMTPSTRSIRTRKSSRTLLEPLIVKEDKEIEDLISGHQCPFSKYVFFYFGYQFNSFCELHYLLIPNLFFFSLISPWELTRTAMKVKNCRIDNESKNFLLEKQVYFSFHLFPQRNLTYFGKITPHKYNYFYKII